MKKFLSAALALLFCLTSALPAFAAGEEPCETAYELWASWMATAAYPDYIAGVWSTDGGMENLTFALVEGAGEAGKEEILSQVRYENTVTFAEGYDYSYNALRAVQQELTQYLGDETGAYSIGVDEMENRVEIGINTGNTGAAAFMERIAEEYGDMVEFEAGDGIWYTTTETSADIEGTQEITAIAKRWNGVYWLPVLALCLLAGGLVLLKQRGLIFQPADGPAASTPRPTFRQVEAEVAAHAEAPPDALRAAILEKLRVSENHEN